MGQNYQKKPLKLRYGWLKNKETNFISSFVGGDFGQPLIAPEARKERSHQSFSASHKGQRADCPFHRPAFFRLGLHKKIPRCHWLTRKQLPMMSLLHYLMLTFSFEISSSCTKIARAHGSTMLPPQRTRGCLVGNQTQLVTC